MTRIARGTGPQRTWTAALARRIGPWLSTDGQCMNCGDFEPTSAVGLCSECEFGVHKRFDTTDVEARRGHGQKAGAR